MSLLETNALGLGFKNPVIVASTDIGRSLNSFKNFSEAGVGGIITKSVTDAPKLQKSKITMFHIADMDQKDVQGNHPSNYYFFSRGGAMMPIEELEAMASKMLKIAEDNNTIVIASISASNKNNWIEYAKRIQTCGFHAIELNFGNPHGEAVAGKLGFLIGQSVDLAVEIVSEVVSATDIPIIAKLTPQGIDIATVAAALEKAGVSAVTIMHRFQGLMFDQETDLPLLGGLAAIGGPWMKPLTLASIAKTRMRVPVEIVGSNGVDTARDVYEYILAGANLVQIGSSMMLKGVDYVKELISELEGIIRQKGGEKLRQLVGQTVPMITPYNQLNLIPERTLFIKKEVCVSCSSKPCISRCYFDALSVSNGELEIDKPKCNVCGMCKYVCPYDAVQIGQVLEEKDEI